MTTCQRGRQPARFLATALTLGLLAVPGATAHAQYFGRNKVQYARFRFEVLETEHFEIHFYPSEEVAARDAARMAERWHHRYAGLLEHELRERRPIILYANHADFQQTNVIPGPIEEGTGGFTEPLKDRVVLPLTASYRDTDHVLGHEIVHAFQFDIAQAPSPDTTEFAIGRLPLWLVEGMAEYLSLGPEDPATAMWMRDAVLHDKIPSVGQLARDPRFFPYRFGQALWAYIGGTWGDKVVPELYGVAGRLGVDAALRQVLGVDADSLSADWAAALGETYGPAIAARAGPEETGEVILSHDRGSGRMNLAPSASPDGETVAFLTERDLFTVDLYLADARTGKVIEKLQSTASNAHFDALRFTDSAGSWSPDGRKFAFVVFRKGENTLAILDVERREVERVVEPGGVRAISNPAWSPDGRTIAFSGSAGGPSDLYLLDLASGAVRALTADRFADLAPAWSPDGRTLAFVTDRGPGTDFSELRYGPRRIGFYDLGSGAIEARSPLAGANHSNPQYAPDGKDLYFVADRGGVPDVYRLDLASGRVFQVTRVATGVSGLTPLSPALSVAARSGRVLFSVFDGGDYNVHALDARSVQGEPVEPTAGPASAAFLPPLEARGERRVREYLGDAKGGLPGPIVAQAAPYRPSLGLDFVGGTVIAGVAVDRFGAGLGGAIGAQWSDVLGDRELGLALLANGGPKDLGGQVSFVNRSRRWNWAAVGGHVPYLTALTSAAVETVTVDGRPVEALVVEQEIERTYVDRGLLVTSYPFSTTRRIELGAAYSRFGFSRELIRRASAGGIVLGETTESLPGRSALNLVQATAALVGDHSFFGFTSPVRGGRYRLEVEPTFGTLTFQSFLADYRRYLFLRPLTLAMRALHYGRYGADAESDRLTPLFVGYETLVRGYNTGSFDLSECSEGEGGSGGESGEECPEFNRLVGSRIGVANLELRVPVLGARDFGLLNFPFLPLELAAFLDGGVAWTQRESPIFTLERRSAARIPVFSTGLSSRLNLLGLVIMEVYTAYPFQRPDRGWLLGFQIAPGW